MSYRDDWKVDRFTGAMDHQWDDDLDWYDEYPDEDPFVEYYEDEDFYWDYDDEEDDVNGS